MLDNVHHRARRMGARWGTTRTVLTRTTRELRVSPKKALVFYPAATRHPGEELLSLSVSHLSRSPR